MTETQSLPLQFAYNSGRGVNDVTVMVVEYGF